MLLQTSEIKCTRKFKHQLEILNESAKTRLSNSIVSEPEQLICVNVVTTLFYCLPIISANSLDQDQARQNVV